MIRKLRMLLCGWLYPGSWDNLVRTDKGKVLARLHASDHAPLGVYVDAGHPVPLEIKVPDFRPPEGMTHRIYTLTHISYAYDEES